MFKKGGFRKQQQKRSNRHSSSKTTRMEEDRKRKGSNRKGPDDGPKRRMNTSRLEQGLIPVTIEQTKAYIAGAYIWRYNEPLEEDWIEYSKQFGAEISVDPRSIRAVWAILKDTNDFECATVSQYRSGRPTKLKKDNKGLIQAVAALNMGVSPEQAMLCNVVNASMSPEGDTPVTVCRNTLMATIKQHTTVLCQRVLPRKTGSRDAISEWAKARLMQCKMTLEMFHLGKELDNQRTTWSYIREKDLFLLYLDGIVFTDQSHLRAVPAGGTGQVGSMSRHQYRISVNKDTGELDPAGVIPKRRSQIRVKYDSYAQGCYSVIMPTINGKKAPRFLETFDYTSLFLPAWVTRPSKKTR